MSAQAGERQALLGHFLRGILHEMANPLNTIMMNAELAAMTAASSGASDELGQILGTVTDEARRGGELVRGLARFLASENFVPVDIGDPGRSIALAQRLVGSLARASGATLRIAPAESLPELPLDELAVALAVAQAIELQIERGARVLSVVTGLRGDALEISIVADDLPSNSPVGRLPPLAQSILADHGGEFDADSNTCVLRLALARPPGG